MQIVLGSKSRSRRLVLKQAGYKFRCATADINEKAIREHNPKRLVIKLARAKTEEILKKQKFPKPSLLVTADQVVLYRGKIREKPESKKQATQFIHSYQFFPMHTVSSVVVTNTSSSRQAAGVHISEVYFNKIPDQVIKDAIAKGRVMHSAGAMRCEEPPLNRYVKRLVGSHDSTSGLPLKLLRRLIRRVSS